MYYSKVLKQEARELDSDDIDDTKPLHHKQSTAASKIQNSRDQIETRHTGGGVEGDDDESEESGSFSGSKVDFPPPFSPPPSSVALQTLIPCLLPPQPNLSLLELK